MPNWRRSVCGGFLASLLLLGSGCSLLPHNLQPHRLWRFNRMPPPSYDANFSVSDPLPNVDRRDADQQQEPCASDVVNEGATYRPALD